MLTYRHDGENKSEPFKQKKQYEIAEKDKESL